MYMYQSGKQPIPRLCEQDMDAYCEGSRKLFVLGRICLINKAYFHFIIMDNVTTIRLKYTLDKGITYKNIDA